jgi:hypothetical protein
VAEILAAKQTEQNQLPLEAKDEVPN